MFWLSVAGGIFLTWLVVVFLFTPGINYHLAHRTSIHAKEFLYTLQSTCQAAVHHGNRVSVATNGAQFYAAMLDAIRAHEQGVGSIDDIDAGMMAGASHPMGPLTLADFVGLDTLAAIGDVMYDEYRERRFAAPPTLRRMVAAGLHGRKSGKGFYDYSGDEPVPTDLGL